MRVNAMFYFIRTVLRDIELVASETSQIFLLSCRGMNNSHHTKLRVERETRTVFAIREHAKPTLNIKSLDSAW